MDLYELQHALQKQQKIETPRPPLGLAEKNSGTTTRRSRTREVSSRYKSPTPVASSCPRRCLSPTVTRTTASYVSIPKRAISAERRRPSTPPSPPSPSPSTPVQDTSTEILGGSKKAVTSRMPETLWPSTMRSLNVSFQSDSFSLPISKREKPVTHVLSDRTLRPSSNVARKQSEITSASRKITPERKRSPLKGKNSSNQSENFRPVEGVHSRLVEQHRWPSRTGGKIASSTTNKSIDLGDKVSRIPSLPHSGSGVPSLRRWSLDGMTKTLQKSASDLLAQVTAEKGGKQSSVDDNSLELNKSSSSTLLDTTRLLNPAVRTQSLPALGSGPASPNRALASLSLVSRAASPLRTKTSITAPSRGPSPARSRPSSPSRQSSNPTSVLSYIVDIKKGKKTANHLEDVHQLRLLYNRQLQWRFANARAEVALQSQEEQAKLTLNGVWRIISDLRHSIIEKRTQLQQLMLKLKLFRILNYQLAFLDEWSIIEGGHADSISQVIKDLQTSTLRLPVTGGARVDIQSVKAAVSSAVDVMQAMGSSICHVLKEVEEMNSLISELADVTSQERAMLDECEAFLASNGATQAMEYSLRTNVIQMRESWGKDQLIFGNFGH